jgi:hypothetical protein
VLLLLLLLSQVDDKAVQTHFRDGRIAADCSAAAAAAVLSQVDDEAVQTHFRDGHNAQHRRSPCTSHAAAVLSQVDDKAVQTHFRDGRIAADCSAAAAAAVLSQVDDKAVQTHFRDGRMQQITQHTWRHYMLCCCCCCCCRLMTRLCRRTPGMGTLQLIAQHIRSLCPSCVAAAAAVLLQVDDKAVQTHFRDGLIAADRSAAAAAAAVLSQVDD